jgi:hypothetical protein
MYIVSQLGITSTKRKRKRSGNIEAPSQSVTVLVSFISNRNVLNISREATIRLLALDNK